MLTVADVQSDEWVGEVSLEYIDDPPDTARLAYSIAPQVRNQGLGFEVAEGMLKIGLRHLRIHTILASCASSNLPSVKILTKLGFAPANPSSLVIPVQPENGEELWSLHE